ncbi:MAG TPA: MFS transporter [Terracidiphilus sp.]|nr:MFS transporter [Terracidiphilus sp.]
MPDDSARPQDQERPQDMRARLRAWTSRYSNGFWMFFAAAFFYDFGFGLFFFLFNLYLTDLHFNERLLGFLTGALTLGNVFGTIPVTILVRRYGLKRLLLVCFIASPLICILRTFILWTPAQIGLAFLTGMAMSSWPICFSPTIAKLTNERNRVAGFSITFATGIGLGTLAGLAGGYLPGILQKAGHAGALIGSMRTVLQLACLLALFGAWPIFKLQLGQPDRTQTQRIRIFHPFLIWFLPPFVVWNIVTGSFPPFAAVYLQQHLGIGLPHVGAIFSISQLLQFTAVLLAPLLYRRWGRIAGVAIAQMVTALALGGMAWAHSTGLAVSYYFAFCGAQWMTGPGIYSFLMDNIPEEERSTASAIQNFSGAICQAATAAITGSCIVRFGYGSVLLGNAGTAVLASLLFVTLLGNAIRKQASHPVAQATMSESTQ